jgi:hypothetical protein
MAGCVGAAAAWPALVQIAHAAAPGADFCVTVCNHWSYIGIGWQLGIESCVLSVTDAMEMADREPHVKTCINLDARAYELMAEKFPEVVAKLAKALAAGKVELIGGTYGQPMGTTIGGESNIRQIVVGWETVLLPMDAWNKSLTWGLGGDQVRVLDRKLEGLLLAAEVFDAAASALGAKSQVELLDKAWKDLMASQSHDVGLCEHSRWQGDRMAPAERLEDKHSLTWGAIGYNHLDATEKQGQQALDATLADLTRRIGSATEPAGAKAVTVLNLHCWPRTDLAATGRLYPLPSGTKDLVVKDRSGKIVPSQIVRSTKDPQGNLLVAEAVFQAQQIPSAGYDTYYLDFTAQAAPAVSTGLVVDEAKLTMENEHVRVRLDPQTGAIASLVYKKSGREMLDAGRGAFPRLTGRPNPNLPLKRDPPAFYDSAKSKAAIDWLAKGPVRAEVRAQHAILCRVPPRTAAARRGRRPAWRQQRRAPACRGRLRAAAAHAGRSAAAGRVAEGQELPGGQPQRCPGDGTPPQAEQRDGTASAGGGRARV